MVRRRNKQINRNHIQIPPMAVRRRNKQKNRNHIQILPMAAMASSPSAPPVPPPPPWTELPADVTANILRRLGVEDILRSAEKVCTTWKNICRDPTTWRVVHLTSNRHVDDRKLGLMCRFAVVRSQGHLTDLSMYYFGDDELLNYVSLRCRNLRRLTLAGPSDISHTGLSNAVNKLPHLEELHLFKTWPPDVKYAKVLRWLMGDGYVHTIGISCPLLRSFTYNEKSGAGSFSETDNLIAEVIAKTMPNLHHLRLKGNLMDNEGLEAMLDGCPRLESLDIRECYCLDDLEAGGLGERCSKQIKFLKLPLKSIE